MRIVIVDDHELVLAGLRRTLNRHFPEAEVAEAMSGRECLQLVAASAWDVAIVDMNLPDRNGLDLLHDIRVLAPGLPVLILSGDRHLGEISRLPADAEREWPLVEITSSGLNSAAPFPVAAFALSLTSPPAGAKSSG